MFRSYLRGSCYRSPLVAVGEPSVLLHPPSVEQGHVTPEHLESWVRREWG